jgi:hypothetical protein
VCSAAAYAVYRYTLHANPTNGFQPQTVSVSRTCQSKSRGEWNSAYVVVPSSFNGSGMAYSDFCFLLLVQDYLGEKTGAKTDGQEVKQAAPRAVGTPALGSGATSDAERDTVRMRFPQVMYEGAIALSGLRANVGG